MERNTTCFIIIIFFFMFTPVYSVFKERERRVWTCFYMTMHRFLLLLSVSPWDFEGETISTGDLNLTLKQIHTSLGKLLQMLRTHHIHEHNCQGNNTPCPIKPVSNRVHLCCAVLVCVVRLAASHFVWFPCSQTPAFFQRAHIMDS